MKFGEGSTWGFQGRLPTGKNGVGCGLRWEIGQDERRSRVTVHPTSSVISDADVTSEVENGSCAGSGEMSVPYLFRLKSGERLPLGFRSASWAANFTQPLLTARTFQIRSD